MERKWYQQTWAIIALLWLFFPVGVYLMWRHASWGGWIKWAVSGALAVLVVFAAIGAAVGGDDDGDDSRMVVAGTLTELPPTEQPTEPLSKVPTEVPTEAPTQSPTTEVIPPYRVVATEDVSFGITVRLVVRAVTDFPITKAQAQAIMDEIIEQISSENRLNALTVFLYDYEELVSGGVATLGSAVFAPDGEWRKADEVDAGDYDRHETEYTFRPKMDDPDAALADRPSSEEVVLCAAFDKADEENPDIYADFAIDDPDQALAEIAAQEVEATAQEIVDAAFKCALWAFR